MAPGSGGAKNAGMTSSEAVTGPVAPRWTKSTVYADMWVDPDDDPRETDVETGDERSTLLDYLRYYRLTMEMKCADLDAEQLARRSVPPSTMSLLGLVRHLAEAELTERFVAGVADLGTRNAGVSDLGPHGADVQRRDVLVAQIAEYARHCGHADLLRERIDGRVGQ